MFPVHCMYLYINTAEAIQLPVICLLLFFRSSLDCIKQQVLNLILPTTAFTLFSHGVWVLIQLQPFCWRPCRVPAYASLIANSLLHLNIPASRFDYSAFAGANFTTWSTIFDVLFWPCGIHDHVDETVDAHLRLRWFQVDPDWSLRRLSCSAGRCLTSRRPSAPSFSPDRTKTSTGSRNITACSRVTWLAVHAYCNLLKILAVCCDVLSHARCKTTFRPHQSFECRGIAIDNDCVAMMCGEVLNPSRSECRSFNRRPTARHPSGAPTHDFNPPGVTDLSWPAVVFPVCRAVWSYLWFCLFNFLGDV
jgi:hypothetical protein